MKNKSYAEEIKSVLGQIIHSLTNHDDCLWHRVAQSAVIGEKSRRRVIYIPIIAGNYQPKHEHSPTAFYQRFVGIVK